MASKTREHPQSLPHELGSFYSIMFAGGPTTTEYDQVSTSQMIIIFVLLRIKCKISTPQEQLSFLKDMSWIIPREENIEVTRLLAIGKRTNKDLDKGILGKMNTRLNGSSSHVKQCGFQDKSFIG